MTIEDIRRMGRRCASMGFTREEAMKVIDATEISGSSEPDEYGWTPYDYFWDEYLQAEHREDFAEVTP